MSRTFSLNQLIEGIRERHFGADSSRLVSKWTRTGLLRGLNEHTRENMARMLENQAAQLLREANTLGAGGGALTGGPGNINGFTNIAFPIVRRVFGGLVANELVSIQPMSLPSGLLFYLDYTYGSDVGGDNNLNADATTSANSATYNAGDSLYGSPSGRDIRTGASAVGGMYDLAGSTYTKVHSQSKGLGGTGTFPAVVASGAYGYQGTSLTATGFLHATGSDGKLIQFDPQLSRQIEAGTHQYSAVIYDAAIFPNIDLMNVKFFAITSDEVLRIG